MINNHNDQLVFVATYQEWLNLISQMQIRMSRKAVQLVLGDPTSFESAMAVTPDMSLSDDQAFLVIVLKPSIVAEGWLSMEDVASFVPLTVRASKLLKADARRANVILEKPVYEQDWQVWKARQQTSARNHRALLFARVIGLETDKENHLQVAENVIAQKPELLTGKKKESLSRNLGTRAYAWIRAYIQLVAESEGAPVSPDQKALKTFVDGGGKTYDLNYPLSNDLPFLLITLNDTFSETIEEKLPEELQRLFLLATIFHYSAIASSANASNDFCLKALLIDLAGLKEMFDEDAAYTAAFCIARAMDEYAVASLIYQAQPDSFDVIEPNPLPHSLPSLRLCQIEDHLEKYRVDFCGRGLSLLAEAKPSEGVPGDKEKIELGSTAQDSETSGDPTEGPLQEGQPEEEVPPGDANSNASPPGPASNKESNSMGQGLTQIGVVGSSDECDEAAGTEDSDSPPATVSEPEQAALNFDDKEDDVLSEMGSDESSPKAESGN